LKREEAMKKNLSKQYSGPAGYKEVGCGTVTLYGEKQEGDEEVPRLETVRYGRAPEYKKKTLTEQLDAEVASILSTRPDVVLVAIADGAEENWRHFDRPAYKDAEALRNELARWQAADPYHPKSSTKRPLGKGLETHIEQLKRRRDVRSSSRTPPRINARRVGFLTYDGTR
jgi:hypothetical protein